MPMTRTRTRTATRFGCATTMPSRRRSCQSRLSSTASCNCCFACRTTNAMNTLTRMMNTMSSICSLRRTIGGSACGSCASQRCVVERRGADEQPVRSKVLGSRSSASSAVAAAAWHGDRHRPHPPPARNAVAQAAADLACRARLAPLRAGPRPSAGVAAPAAAVPDGGGFESAGAGVRSVLRCSSVERDGRARYLAGARHSKVQCAVDRQRWQRRCSGLGPALPGPLPGPPPGPPRPRRHDAMVLQWRRQRRTADGSQPQMGSTTAAVAARTTATTATAAGADGSGSAARSRHRRPLEVLLALGTERARRDGCSGSGAMIATDHPHHQHSPWSS